MKEEKSCDYLSPSRTVDDGNFVTRSDRTDIVDWMYSIVERYPFDHEMVPMAMGVVDRFLSKPSIIAQGALQDRKQYKLVAIAALSIYIETDKNNIMPGSEFLADPSSNICSFNVNEIKDMESNIIQALSSGIHAPTSIQMAEHFLSLALPGVNLEESRWSCVLDDVRFQTEHAVRDYYFTTQFPSTLAMAAMLNAFDEISGPDLELMLRVFPSILSQHLASPTDLVAAKNRLRDTMGRGLDTFVSDEIIMSMGKALAD